VDVNGYKLSLIPNDAGISTELALFGTHEPLNTRMLAKQLREGMTCFDIGANIGYYTLLESRIVGKNGKIIAMEPSPVNFSKLQKNIQMEGAKNIELFNLAGGNKDGKIKFLLKKQSNLSRIVSEDEITPSDNIIEVPIRKLDGFLQDLSLEKLDFLRMDVEGYEFYIYEGIRNSVKKYKPDMQIEIHAHHLGERKTRELLEKIKEDGYETEYYIVRQIDIPTVGDMDDVKKVKIDTLLEMLDEKRLPTSFLLFLKNILK
jgi:FkbM family methyltransferase